MELLAVSISHENTPISIREKVSFTKKKQAEILKYIKQNIAEECVLLSTCNRCEFYLAGYNMKDKFIDCLVSLTDEFVKKYISIYEGDDCSRHLALTASGLKSMILGEDQILGQVKDAHEFAKEHLCCGKYLNTLFRISVTGAKKVKTETLLSKTPVSAATIAIKQCQSILGTLNDKNILIIGASGKTGSIVLKDLLSLDGVNIYATSRTHDGIINHIDGAITVDYEKGYEIKRENEKYVISGSWIEAVGGSVNFSDQESLQYFQRALLKRGVIEDLINMGIKEGEIVQIGDLEFEFVF